MTRDTEMERLATALAAALEEHEAAEQAALEQYEAAEQAAVAADERVKRAVAEMEAADRALMEYCLGTVGKAHLWSGQEIVKADDGSQ